jgi:hypothetical protein
MKGLSIMGYDPENQVYTYSAFDNAGHAEFSRGAYDKGTWSWTSESKMNGKPLKSRFTLKEVSPTVYTFKWDGSYDGSPWTTMMEGKATKSK